MEKKWYRFNVVAKFPKYQHKFAFLGTDKEQTFVSCVNFADGFIHGFSINSNMPISTNCAPSIDGFIWWNTLTNDKVLYIEDENGKVILTSKDL